MCQTEGGKAERGGVEKGGVTECMCARACMRVRERARQRMGVAGCEVCSCGVGGAGGHIGDVHPSDR